VLNATTYVVLENEEKQEIGEYRAEKETARQERNKSRNESEAERRKMMEANGVKFTKLTADQIAANKRYDKEKDNRDRMEEEMELLNMPQVGEVSVIIFFGWFLVGLAVVVTLGSPVYQGIKSILQKRYKSVFSVSLLVLILLRFVVFIIKLGFWGIEISDETSTSMESIANGSLYLTMIMITVAVVAMLSAPLVERVKQIIQKDYKPVIIVLVVTLVIVRFLWFMCKLLFAGVYITESNGESSGLVSGLLVITFILVDIAIIGMICYPLWGGVKRILKQDYKPSAKVAVYSLALITFLVMIIKLMLPNDLMSSSTADGGSFVDVSLVLTYIMLIVTGIGIVGSEVYSLIKRW
jgi:hypothetical protein